MAGTSNVDSGSDYGSDILTDLGLSCIWARTGAQLVAHHWKQSDRHGERGRSENQGRGRGLDGGLDWSQNKCLKDEDKERRQDLGFFLESTVFLLEN